VTVAETALRESQERIRSLEDELATRSCASSERPRDDETLPVNDLIRCSKPIPKKKKQPPTLIETRLIEARYMQWASSVYLRLATLLQ
jgi:hypothetical protein